MAGGMGRRGLGLPNLGERSARAAKADLPDRARHCWVIGAGGERWPGLLLEWRKQDDRWQGLVSYLQPGDGDHKLIQSWLDSDVLRSGTG